LQNDGGQTSLLAIKAKKLESRPSMMIKFVCRQIINHGAGQRNHQYQYDFASRTSQWQGIAGTVDDP